MIFFNDEWNKPKPLSREVLIKRGQCCNCGCKNCPYTKPRRKGNKKLEKQ